MLKSQRNACSLALNCFEPSSWSIAVKQKQEFDDKHTKWGKWDYLCSYSSCCFPTLALVQVQLLGGKVARIAEWLFCL
jgi:hypothetical protein